MARKRHNRGRARAGHHRVASASREGGGSALEVDGVVQSVRVDLASDLPQEGRGESGGYWELMLPTQCPRRALIVGLGGGTVAALLARACLGIEIIGIERDEGVLALARLEFALDAIPGLHVVVADAFAEVGARAEREPGSYDYICLDLYEGARLAPGTLATAFLRHLATLLAPNGALAVNLVISGRLGEQLHRLARVFTISAERRTKHPGGNLVVHARLRPPGESDIPR